MPARELSLPSLKHFAFEKLYISKATPPWPRRKTPFSLALGAVGQGYERCYGY